jgi:hypothetical protein
MAKARISPVLPLPDFERIFRTIHGVLLNEDCRMAHACLFFGIIGAAILKAHHRKDAIPVVGVAAFNLGGPNDVLAFVDPQPQLRTSSSAFHCWVEFDGWFIDFSSPLYREMVESVGGQRHYSRKMFQRPLTQSCATLSEVGSTEGTFFCQADDSALVREHVGGFIDADMYRDILKICLQWYRRHPKKMLDTIGVADQHGRTQPVRLSTMRLDGAW